MAGSASASTRTSRARWSGRIGADQIEWIRGQLDDRRPRAAVLFMHHLPVELGVAWLDRIGLEDADLLRDLLAEIPASGSSAAATSITSRPTTWPRRRSTVPSTGLQFSPVSDVAQFVTGPPGYRIIELHENGTRRRWSGCPRPATRRRSRDGPPRRGRPRDGGRTRNRTRDAIALAAIGTPVVVAARSVDGSTPSSRRSRRREARPRRSPAT